MMTTKTIALCSLLALAACSDDDFIDDGSDHENMDEAVQAISGTQGDVVATGSGQFTMTYTSLDTAAIRAAVDAANASGALLGARTINQVLSGANRTLAYKTAAACATAKGSLSKLDDAAHRVGAWCFDSGDRRLRARAGRRRLVGERPVRAGQHLIDRTAAEQRAARVGVIDRGADRRRVEVDPGHRELT